MRRSAAAATSLAWFVVIGGTFGCLVPYLSGDWRFHQPLPYWWSRGSGRAADLRWPGPGGAVVRRSFVRRHLPCRWRRRHAW